MSDDRAARREAAVLVALITIAVVIAPFSPKGVGLVMIVILAGAAALSTRQRTWFRNVVARHHSSPFARLCDSLLGVVAMGLADAATLQSTLIAGLLGGRPLR